MSAEQVDSRRFEGLLGDARRAAPDERRALFVRALELWRGPPLAEFAFEEWAQNEVRRLDELRLIAVEELIATDIELGHPADVVAELEALVREQPLRERAWYLLMSARHRAGRSAEALQAYERPAPRSTRSASSRARISAGSRARYCVARDGRNGPTATPRIATARS